MQCQYLQTTTLFASLFSCTIADFKPSPESTGDLIDDLPSSLNLSLPVYAIAGQTYIIPIRTGVSTVNGVTNMVTPSETYDAVGNLVSAPVGTLLSTYSSAANLAFGINTNDTIAVNYDFVASAGQVVAFYADVAASAVLIHALIGSITTTAGRNFGTVSYNVPSTPDRLYGVSVNIGGNSTINAIKVNYTYGNTAYVGNPNFITPFSRYIGQAVKSANVLGLAAESERTIASSMLYSDFSAQLTIAGMMFGMQVDSGNYPAESGLGGLYSAGTYPCAFNGAQRKGFYSAPFKMIDVESSTFTPLANDWRGTQPYSVSYTRIPNTATPYFRIEIADIFEFKTTAEQVFEEATQILETPVLEWLKACFAEHQILHENPLHLAGILDFAKKCYSILPKYIHGLVSGVGSIIDEFNQ